MKYVVAGGVSQSASQLASFINNGYNRGLVDAYNIERDLGATYNDFSTFIFSMDEETSFTSQPAAPRQPDNPHFVVWERPARRMSQSAGGSTDWRRRRSKATTARLP